MTRIITAVYEKNVLRPLRPLDLRENQTVRLQIIPDLPDGDEGEDAVHLLIAAGLMRPSERAVVPPDPLSEEERRALADRLGQAAGKPVSELVLEDRGEA